MSERPTPTFDPYPWNQNGPGRSHRPEVMYPCDDGEWVKLDDFREIERQLAERDAQLEVARTALEDIKDHDGGNRYDYREITQLAEEALARIDAKHSSR